MRCESSDGWEDVNHRGGADVKTIVLLGKTGNGKSATGNTVIGRKVFDSKRSFGGVTSTCKLESTVLYDGQILNVIDTPGLFDSAVKPHVIATEIAKCINLAKDGIHAVLLILTLGGRFSVEEASAFEGLCQIFGGKIAEYMIVVFTHGDVLEEGSNFGDLLGDDNSSKLMSILETCGDRVVVFDNKTKDAGKILQQRDELLSLVESVVESNGGKPYTNDLFDELKRNMSDESAEGTSSEGKLRASNEEQFDRLIEMVELRLKESIQNLEKQLSEERAARVEADRKALELQTQSKDEVHGLKENLEKQLAEERAARVEAELKALELQFQSKDEVYGLKENMEKQLAEERAARVEAKMKALELRTQSKDEVHGLKESLNRAEESRRQLEERLHAAENKVHCVIM